MSSTIPLGGRRSCTRSIHWPERSARTDRFFSAASHLVSKRPIWLGDAAQSEAALLADDPLHRGIMAQALSVVHIFISGKPTEHRLSQHSSESMPAIPAGAGVGEHLVRHRAEAERIVEFAIGK